MPRDPIQRGGRGRRGGHVCRGDVRRRGQQRRAARQCARAAEARRCLPLHKLAQDGHHLGAQRRARHAQRVPPLDALEHEGGALLELPHRPDG